MNTIFFVIFLLVYTYLSVTRFLYWLSVLQQKEYRLDRLTSYFKDNTSQALLGSLLLTPFSLKSLKRPKFTQKAILIAISSFVIIFVCLYNFINLLVFLCVYLLLPVFILAASLPFAVITQILTLYYQIAAIRLFSKHKPTVIGITGSYGKTTTKLILAQILKSQLKTWNSPKSHNTPLSLPKAIVETYKGEKYVVLEFAAYKKGEIKRLANLFPPDMAILTGITHQHEAIFGSFENLIKAKSELPDSLKADSVFAFNNHDRYAAQIAAKYPYLITKPTDLAALENPAINNQGQLEFVYKNTKIKTKLIGYHYLSNMELAIIIANDLGVTKENIASSLRDFVPSPEFITSFTNKSGSTVIDDGKSSNPEGFSAAINIAASMDVNTKIIVTPGIIDLGAKSKTIHLDLAKKISKTFDLLIHTSDTASDEFKQVLGKKYTKITSTEDLSKALADQKGTGMILIEGRLSQTYQQIIKNN